MTAEEHNAAFDRWLTEHAAVLHHVANGFADGADRHDLMQELLLAVWRAIPVFRHGAQPSTFIYRVAHNAALTWRRTQANYRKRVESFEAYATAPDLPGGNRERVMLEFVYAHLRTLPPLDRSLLLLQLDGLSYAQIAEIHGLSEGNVGARLTRLKHRLTQNLQELAHELR